AMEIANGWILLFDGESNFGWKMKGDAAVNDGALTLGDQKTSAITTIAALGNGELQFQVRWEGHANANLLLHNSKRKLEPVKQQDKETWHRCDVKIDGNSIAGFSIQGPSGGTGEEREGSIGKSRATFGFQIEKGGKLLLRNIKYKPASFELIFNGKDLTGWKEIKTP